MIYCAPMWDEKNELDSSDILGVRQTEGAEDGPEESVSRGFPPPATIGCGRERP
jgi:hypothetical protein